MTNRGFSYRERETYERRRDCKEGDLYIYGGMHLREGEGERVGEYCGKQYYDQ